MAIPGIDEILKMLNLDKGKKDSRMYIIIASVIAVGVYVFLLLMPAVSEFSKTRAHAAKERKNLERTERIFSNEKLYRKQLKDMEGKVNLYEEQLPVDHQVKLLLEELSKIAKESNVVIREIASMKAKDVQQGKADGKKPYQELPITVKAVSGYHELGKFVNKMESASRFMKISNIKIKTNRDNEREHAIFLVINTYVLLQGE